MTTERVTLTGIRPAAGSVRPDGIHLRWAFPPSRGFPRNGFAVYRRESEDRKFPCADFAGLGHGSLLRPGDTLGDLTFRFHETARLVGAADDVLRVEQPGMTPMRVEFTEPVVHVEIRVARRSGPVALRAFSSSSLVAESSRVVDAGGVDSIKVSASGIDAVVFPLAFGELRSICTQTEADACTEDWGSPVVVLALVTSATEALKRLEATLGNRYAASRADAVQRYSAELPELIRWLQLLQSPNDPAFANPGAPPDDLRIAFPDAPEPLREIRPLSILLLASLDPNIARFLSLYWVDVDGGSNGPKPRTAYDYKVVGRWADLELCGLLLEAGAEPAKLPSAPRPVTAGQLPGIRWRGRDPLGRLGVRWPRPAPSAPALAPVSPVLFDVERRIAPTGSRPGPLTERAPVLVSGSRHRAADAPCFVDRDLPLDSYVYRIQGIDVFGQVGEHADSEAVEVKDLEAPPPPIRVEASLTQPGFPWLTDAQRAEAGQPAKLEVGFEFGAGQYQQAPDAETFRIYWRPDRLFSSVPATVTIESTTAVDDGQVVHEVRAATPGNLDLKGFTGGVLTNVVPSLVALPVAERRRFRLADVVDGNRLRLAPTTATLREGSGWRLVSDPHQVAGWILLGTVTARQPIEGVLLANAADALDFGARAADVRERSLGADPLALLPADRRPGPTEAAPAVVEVLLDRALFEPDLFSGGTAEVGGQQFNVVYATAGPSFADDRSEDQRRTARVGLPTGATVAAGDRLVLRPAATAAPDGVPQGTVRDLMIAGNVPDDALRAPGGEIVLEVRDGSEVRTYLARAVSTPEREAGRFKVLARFAADPALDLGALRANQAQCRYFPRYVAGWPIVLQDAVPGDSAVALPISPDKGTRSAYVTVMAEDLRGRRGPLSVPVQVSAVRPPPIGAPGAPSPCGYAAATAAYATPPDRTGRATVCLEWDAGTLGATTGLRYEVSRALDNAIVATDRRGWLQGSAEPGLPPVAVQVTSVREVGDSLEVDARLPTVPAGFEAAAFEGGLLEQGGRHWVLTDSVEQSGQDLTVQVPDAPPGPPATGNALLFAIPVVAGRRLTGRITSSSLAGSGVYRVAVADVRDSSGASADVDAALLTALAGGRLDSTDRSFQISRAARGPALTLLVRPTGSNGPTSGDCTITTPPDYAFVGGDHAKLRQLAAKPSNSDAFGIVTGTPISATRFTDEVPGTGRNRFFYRVRAVDPAENRSSWSAISPPFHLVDTTPPRAPQLVAIAGGDRRAVVQWRSDPSGETSLFRVYRANDPALLERPRAEAAVTVIDPATAPPSDGVHAFTDEPLPGLLRGSLYHYRVEAVKRVASQATPPEHITVAALGDVASAYVFDTRPPPAPTAVRVQRHVQAGWPQIRLEWTAGERLRFLVKRRAADSTIFAARTDWLDTAQHDPATDQWRYHFDDTGVGADQEYVYQVVVGNQFGNQAASPPFPEA